MRSLNHVAGLVFVAVLGCSSTSAVAAVPQSSDASRPETRKYADLPRKYVKWLGAEAVGVLTSADRVEPFAVRTRPQVHPRQGAPGVRGVLPPETPATISGYPVYAVGDVQKREFAQRLASLLFDDKSYLSEGYPFGRRVIKGCVLVPAVAFRVWAGQKWVDVLVGFRCNQVSVYAPKDRVRRPIGDIDSAARAAFVRLAKEALPRVSEIAAIPEVMPPDL